MYLPLRRHAPPGAPFLVAFSGGPDSVALVLILEELGYEVILAYVDHGLRGLESAREADWVRGFAQRKGLPLEVLKVREDMLRGKRGIQAAARNIRYQWMESLLNQGKGFWGATAHILEDQIETLLYRLVRSPSPKLWEGIPYRRGRWLRPLLYCHREEIISYLRSRQEGYLLDSSNYTPKYFRNQMRWWSLPPLYQINPSLAESWVARWKLYRLQWKRLWACYSRWMSRWLSPTPYGEIGRGPAAKDALYVVAKIRWRLTDAAAHRLWTLWKAKRSGAYISTGGRVFVRVPQGLQVGLQEYWMPLWPEWMLSEGGGTCFWGLWELKAGDQAPQPGERVLAWNKHLLHFPLRVRLWKRGDTMRPEGLEGHTKRLSDIWPEIGVYGFERKHAFVVEDAEGRIIGAAGYRVAAGMSPSSPETEIFYLRAVYGRISSASEQPSYPGAQST
ncbi:MAG: tRNA lysidine(34) synthetase TilS [Bacteroidia bacterium]|nr:tRNA lysidine(34) synthetase TilS [Bacteroidia bacterium]